MNFIKDIESLLPLVEKPGRYTGGEFNQIRKNWGSVKLKVALAFPDLYEIGLPNLGLAILYSEINSREDSLAERVYSPWVDFESLLREREISLFSLENKRDLKEFDLIGFSLPYETLYSNVLNMLDLSGIAIEKESRQSTDPIIIAGGHSCFNPEPMHAFIDAFVIGEGEEVIHELLNAIIAGKEGGVSRSDIIASFAQIAGIYIPDIHKNEAHKKNSSNAIVSGQVTKRIVNPLHKHITKFLVPNIEIVHNRVSIEIMRGCTRGCRFCQAGMITRPVRERSRSEIFNAIKDALANTGFEDVSLLSLSSSDHSEITDMMIDLSKYFSQSHQRISLPSLRIESFTQDLMEVLGDQKKGNFTLAPEAATETMRSRINKPISSQSLLDITQNIYSHGWQNIKLYFMIGFPEETLDDVQAIIELCLMIRGIGRKTIGNRAKLSVSINTLVPKPHTPFQWVPFASRKDIEEKQKILRTHLMKNGIRVSMPSYDSSLLEALLSRGDRQLSAVIKDAWKKGAKFDAWNDLFDFNIWKSAFGNANIDAERELTNGFDVTKVLPWDNISTGISKKFLLEEFSLSQMNITQPDCRNGCVSCGIQTTFQISCKEALRHE